MKIQRSKNARRNILFGTILKGYQIVVPFGMRTLMIYQMGMDYAGLNNLFTSIFQILNLAELGIGAALTFSMYKPIADDDESKICALMKLYRKCLAIIGAVVLFLGSACIPFLQYLVKGSIPDNLNLHFLYVLYLANTVLSYWLFAYKKSLIYAHQRTDINSKIVLLTSSLQYILQIYVLVVIRNYYLYLISSIVAQIVSNILSAIVVNKTYPRYKAAGDLDRATVADIAKKVQGLVMNKIGGTILRSVDSIVISAFLGLSVLAIYQNYYFIFMAVASIFSVIFEACIAGIGNSLVIESPQKNYKDFKILTFIIGWLLCVCSSCFICLFQPFMSLWVGDEYLLEFSLVICFVIYFFLFEIDQLVGAYKDAAGIWYTDRYRPLITAIVNLIMNIIMVQTIGLYGVLLSTVISLLVIGLPWLIYNVFRILFEGQSIATYVWILFKFAFCAILVSAVTSFLCSKIAGDGILIFIMKMIVSVAVSDLLLLIIFFRSEEFNKLKKSLLIKELSSCEK